MLAVAAIAVWALSAMHVAGYVLVRAKAYRLRETRGTVVEVISPPRGDAPLAVRKAWVGLTLPLASGETGPRMIGIAGLLKDWRGWPDALRRVLFGAYDVGYLVDPKTALTLLQNRSPEAFAWWRENTPELLRSGRTFAFSSKSCRLVDVDPRS